MSRTLEVCSLLNGTGDNNMSDTLILGLVLGFFTMITTLLTIVLNGSQSRRNARLLHELNKKVEEYHAETNSKLSQLVVAEKGVSYAEGKEQGRTEQQEKLKEVPPETGKITGTGIKKDLTQAKEKIEQAKKKLDKI